MNGAIKTFFPIMLSFIVSLNSISAGKLESKENNENDGGESVVEKYTREELSFGIEGYEVQGELIKPKGQKKPLKLAIIVGGSGSTNRDASVGEIHPYKDIAEGLAEKGIATFRYDKRAYSHGDKLNNEEAILNFTLKEEYLDDYNEIMKYFSNQNDIDKDNICVIGHSEGGYIIPLLEKVNSKAVKYISLGGCSTNLRELMIEQLQEILDTQKESLKEEEKSAYLFGIEELKRAGNLTNDSPNEIIMGASSKYWLEINNYNTLDEFKKVNKPMLFLQGLNDWNSRETELIAFEKALIDRKDVEFKRYEGLNHAFIKGEMNNLWPFNPGNVEQEVINDIANFINK